MKKLLFSLSLLLLSLVASSQTLKTTIQNKLFAQGIRGVTTQKIRDVFNIFADSVSSKPSRTDVSSIYALKAGDTFTGPIVVKNTDLFMQGTNNFTGESVKYLFSTTGFTNDDGLILTKAYGDNPTVVTPVMGIYGNKIKIGNSTIPSSTVDVTDNIRDVLSLNSTNVNGVSMVYKNNNTTFAKIGSAYYDVNGSALSDLQINANNNGKLYLVTGGFARLVITSTGNVGIGTAAATSKFQVVGLPVYPDNASALSGGLTAGAFYRTSSGQVMVAY